MHGAEHCLVQLFDSQKTSVAHKRRKHTLEGGLTPCPSPSTHATPPVTSESSFCFMTSPLRGWNYLGGDDSDLGTKKDLEHETGRRMILKLCIGLQLGVHTCVLLWLEPKCVGKFWHRSLEWIGNV